MLMRNYTLSLSTDWVLTLPRQLAGGGGGVVCFGGFGGGTEGGGGSCNRIVPLPNVNSRQSAHLKIVEKTVYTPDLQPE